jgi:hypothetical protein
VFNDFVVEVVDDVDVVAGAAIHGVFADPSVQIVVTAAADEDVVAVDVVIGGRADEDAVVGIALDDWHLMSPLSCGAAGIAGGASMSKMKDWVRTASRSFKLRVASCGCDQTKT